MRRGLALLWAAALLAAGLYLAVRIHTGLPWRTDLLALLPHDAQDVQRQHAEDAVTRALSQRVLVLVGHRDQATAIAAARTLEDRLRQSGVAGIEPTVPGPEALVRLGTLYAPFRRGLLSDSDRAALQRGDGQAVADRALSQVFGFVGISDAKLLRSDPFLLLPGFFTALPVPFAKVRTVDGVPMVTDGHINWVLVIVRLTEDPYSLDVQARLDKALALPDQQGLRTLRLGAAFFAHAGAETALDESTRIGLLSTLGTVLLILLAYRALAPLWLSLLVIGAGVLIGLVASLLIFDELHVATLLFGVSLIGVAVDYSLQYCTEIFAAPADPPTRLRRVRVGIALGTTTTVIGYLTLLFAPFPGLYQIATFSAAGLVAAWLTVMLWLPALDRSRPPRHGRWMLEWMAALLTLWHGRRRSVIAGVALVVAVAGLSRLHADDDVRRMQSLSAPLVAQQKEIHRLIGGIGEGPFFLIRAANDDAALRAEEALADRLTPLRRDSAVAGWLAPALFVPSAERQLANQALVARVLDPMQAEHMHRLGLDAEPGPGTGTGPAATNRADVNTGRTGTTGLDANTGPNAGTGPVLTLKAVLAAGGPFASLVIAPGIHVVLLDGLAKPDAISAAANGLPGVTYVDPAGQFSALLAKYRVRAIGLLAVSALLMAPPLVWRYGWRGALRIMVPPALAVLLAPALRAFAGAGFGFFDAMALVLVLSIGVDYAIFCAETRGDRAPVTMLAVTLAAGTALLSFGLLALSQVAAVHAFGSTMTLGILLAFALAPMAREDSA